MEKKLVLILNNLSSLEQSRLDQKDTEKYSVIIKLGQIQSVHCDHSLVLRVIFSTGEIFLDMDFNNLLSLYNQIKNLKKL